MKNTTYKKITWECGECGNTHESYSNKIWDMQVCKCGKTGYDLEEFYSRVMGNVKVIKEETFQLNNDED